MNRFARIVALLMAIGAAKAWAQAQPADVADALTLIREAKQSQDWLMRVASFRVKFQSETVSQPRPATTQPGIAQSTTQPTTAPRIQSTELAWDRTRLYSSILSPLSPTPSVRFWDGKIAGYNGRENYYELTDISETTKRSFMTSLTWGRSGQVYWWNSDRPRADDFIGTPESFLLAGAETFHGVECWVLEGGAPPTRVYVGKETRRLHGSSRGSGSLTHWYIDYKEVAPGCWYPMTQGTDSYAPVGGGRSGAMTAAEAAARPMYLSSVTTSRVVEIAVNQPLPDELFKPALKEGMQIHEVIGGTTRDYVYSANRTPEEADEMRADAARRKLFAPPQFAPGQSIPLNSPVAPLPLNPLVLSPAADFPAEANWLNGQPVKLAGLRGKVVLIVFWASWREFTEDVWGSKPTPPDAKLLDAIKQDVVVIGVHVPTTNSEKVQRAIQKYDFAFPVCIDVPVNEPDKGWGTMAETYRLDEMPATYVIDQEGKVAALGSWAVAVTRAKELLGVK